MVPLKPTTKESQSRSHSITNRAPSSTSSLKRSVESASFTNNYSDDLDDEMGREKQVLEKLPNYQKMISNITIKNHCTAKQPSLNQCT